MTPIKGTGDGNLTRQSEGWWGQRMAAFILTIFAVNGTMGFATWMKVPTDLSQYAVIWVCIIGGVLILGRTGVHIFEAWAQSKLGKVESRTVHEEVMVSTPPKKK